MPVRLDRHVDIRGMQLYGWSLLWIILRLNSLYFLISKSPGVHPMLRSELLLS